MASPALRCVLPTRSGRVMWAIGTDGSGRGPGPGAPTPGIHLAYSASWSSRPRMPAICPSWGSFSVPCPGLCSPPPYIHTHFANTEAPAHPTWPPREEWGPRRGRERTLWPHQGLTLQDGAEPEGGCQPSQTWPSDQPGHAGPRSGAPAIVRVDRTGEHSASCPELRRAQVSLGLARGGPGQRAMDRLALAG